MQERQCLWLGLICITLDKSPLRDSWYVKIMPLFRTFMYDSRKKKMHLRGPLIYVKQWKAHLQRGGPILVYWTEWREPRKINCPSLGFYEVPSLQTGWKWPQLHRPYQMLVMNAVILNKISLNMPWSGMHWPLLLLPKWAKKSKDRLLEAISWETTPSILQIS